MQSLQRQPTAVATLCGRGRSSAAWRDEWYQGQKKARSEETWLRGPPHAHEAVTERRASALSVSIFANSARPTPIPGLLKRERAILLRAAPRRRAPTPRPASAPARLAGVGKIAG